VERIFYKFASFDERKGYEIHEFINMTIEERQATACELKNQEDLRYLKEARKTDNRGN